MKLKKLLKRLSGFDCFQLYDWISNTVFTPVFYQEDGGVFEAIKPYLACKVKRIASGRIVDDQGTYIAIGVDLGGKTDEVIGKSFCEDAKPKMDIPEIIARLEDLRRDRECFLDGTEDNIFLHDMNVLSAAVERLKELEGQTDD